MANLNSLSSGFLLEPQTRYTEELIRKPKKPEASALPADRFRIGLTSCNP